MHYCTVRNKGRWRNRENVIGEAQYVIARFEVNASEFQEAWDWVYGQWMPASGYEPDDKPCFEMYPEEPKNGKFIVDICVPVKPL